MRKLAKTIQDELRFAPHCAVYKDEINRVWPTNGKKREAKIVQFADKHGWRVRYYREDLCAIFDKKPGGG